MGIALGNAPDDVFRRRLVEPLFMLLIGAVLFTAPLWLSPFRLQLLGKFLAFALVAIAIDLIWGYTGMLSLGHGVFFGLGAYAMGMFLKLEASGRWPPDFMLWSGMFELPALWRPFRSFAFASAASILVPAALALVLGYVVFRNRIRGPYFAIITQALALIVSILFVGQQPYTGGTNGITNFSTMLGAPLGNPAVQRTLYLITAAAVVLAVAFSRWLVNTPYGRLLVAVRESENRVRFCGYDAAWIKVSIFVVSAALAGLAGALFIPQVGIISPAMMGVVPSIEMVVWVAVGGRGTIYGALLGALLVNFAKTFLSESFPSGWLYLYGALFAGTVLFFPAGIAGVFTRAGRLLPFRGTARVPAAGEGR